MDQTQIVAGSAPAGSIYKVAASYALNDRKVSLNGAGTVTDSVTRVFLPLEARYDRTTKRGEKYG